MAAHDVWGTVGQDVDPDRHNDQSHYLARQRQGGVGDRLTQPDTGNADRDQRVDRCDDGQNGGDQGAGGAPAIVSGSGRGNLQKQCP